MSKRAQVMTAHCLSSNLCDQEIMCKQTLHALILNSKQTVDVKNYAVQLKCT